MRIGWILGPIAGGHFFYSKDATVWMSPHRRCRIPPGRTRTSATNRDLQAAIAAGTFRSALSPGFGAQERRVRRITMNLTSPSDSDIRDVNPRIVGDGFPARRGGRELILIL
jgi:hypothetical protein